MATAQKRSHSDSHLFAANGFCCFPYDLLPVACGLLPNSRSFAAKNSTPLRFPENLNVLEQQVAKCDAILLRFLVHAASG